MSSPKNHPILQLALELKSKPNIWKALKRTYGSEEAAVTGALLHAANAHKKSSRIAQMFVKTSGIVDSMCREQSERMLDFWRGKSYNLKTASPLMIDQELDPKTFVDRQQPTLANLLRQYEATRKDGLMRKNGVVLHGGLAERRHKHVSDFSPKAVAAGVQVEREHTNDKTVQKHIAMDHLTEDPKYYSKLKKMEKTAQPFSPAEHYALWRHASGFNVNAIKAKSPYRAKADHETGRVYLYNVATPKTIVTTYQAHHNPDTSKDAAAILFEKLAQGNEGFRTQDYDDQATYITQEPESTIASRDNYKKYLNRGRQQIKKAATTSDKIIRAVQKELNDPKFYTKTVLPIAATVGITKLVSGKKSS